MPTFQPTHDPAPVGRTSIDYPEVLAGAMTPFQAGPLPSTALGASISTALDTSPSTALGASISTALDTSPSTSLGASISTSLRASPSTALRASQRRESNPQPPLYKSGALPLSYAGNLRPLPHNLVFVRALRHAPSSALLVQSGLKPRGQQHRPARPVDEGRDPRRLRPAARSLQPPSSVRTRPRKPVRGYPEPRQWKGHFIGWPVIRQVP